jgi:hypothetical protein
LFDQAPELDLADFYISNDKHPDAEAVLTAFLRDLKDKVPEEEWIWFRTRALVVKVKMRQRLWGAAVSAGKEALEPLHVRVAMIYCLYDIWLFCVAMLTTTAVQEDEKFADPAVVAVVLAMADALVRLHDAEHGAALLKSCVARVFHCEKDSKVGIVRSGVNVSHVIVCLLVTVHCGRFEQPSRSTWISLTLSIASGKLR